MIRPRFSLSQDEKTVSILIRAPYCSLGELDVSVEEHVFIFSCHPYYLRLHLPGKIEENDDTRSSFNSDTGEFTFQYEKVNVGEHFPDLEFVTKLLCAKIEIEEGNRKIEVLESDIVDASIETSDTNDNGEEYGFAMRGGYNFKTLSTEFSHVFEVDPLLVKLNDRTELRQRMEQKNFDSEHYVADLLDNEEIKELINLEVPWENFTETNKQFTEQELDFLKDLSNVDYNLNQRQIKYCHYGLLDILYAYCYDSRTTCFEATCESSWTISKVSASLCWFDGFANTKQSLICAFRRSLIYPLYRNYDLSTQILKDLKKLIKLGEQFIIKCLINIYNIFLTGNNGRYILNNVFIKDYIVYIMKWDKNLWLNTLEELEHLVIEKNDLGLGLLEVEARASGGDLSDTMAKLNINDDSDDSDDISSSSSDSGSYGESDSTDTDLINDTGSHGQLDNTDTK